MQQHLALLREGKLSRYTWEYRLVNRDGERVWINSHGQCQIDDAGRPQIVISRISDTVLKPQVDPLTGVFNTSRLAQDITRIQQSKIPATLMMFGVDNLKNINLRHGREYGDRILRQIADTLEELLGPGLRVYRVGGLFRDQPA